MSGDRSADDDEPRRRNANEEAGRRTARTSGLVRIALARFRGQVTGVATGKSTAIVAAVALTLALLVVVTGLSLALVDGGIAAETDADARIEAADSPSLSSVNGIERPRLANASERTATLRSADGVDRATPVFVEPVPVRTGDDPIDDPGAYERILAVGVDPGTGDGVVAGLPIDTLSGTTRDDETADRDDDAAGNDSGIPVDGVVLSETAADRLGVAAGETVTVASGTEAIPLTVSAVEPASGDGQAPVALVDRAALLAYAGGADDSLADRILVWGDEDAAVDAAADAYPSASVETTDSTHPAALFEDELALATSVVATIVALAVCALFVATTAGMAVAEDRPQLAILTAVGFSSRSRLAIVTTTVLATVLGGSILGIGLGFAAGHGVNALSNAVLGSGSVVAFHPLLVPYTVGVAVVAALLALPYPLRIAAKTDVVTAVDR